MTTKPLAKITDTDLKLKIVDYSSYTYPNLLIIIKLNVLLVSAHLEID